MARGGHIRQGLCSTSRFCTSTLSILYLLSLTGSAGSEEQLEQRQLSATASCFGLVMYDSYGDGWDVATYSIQQFSNIESIASGTLANGYQGTDEICLDVGCYTIRAMSGRWPSEITWELGGLTGSAIPQSPTAVPSMVGTPQVDLGAEDDAIFSYQHYVLSDDFWSYSSHVLSGEFLSYSYATFSYGCVITGRVVCSRNGWQSGLSNGHLAVSDHPGTATMAVATWDSSKETLPSRQTGRLNRLAVAPARTRQCPRLRHFPRQPRPCPHPSRQFQEHPRLRARQTVRLKST